MNNWKLHQSLKKHGLNYGLLAQRAGVGRSHLSQVLANVAGRGGHTRRKLFEHLTHEELILLGWTAEWQDWQKKRAEKMEQRSTGNNVPMPAAPAIESGVAA